MQDVVISIDNLTKDYGHGRGIFDIDLEIHRGEVFGYVGTNGSGKTTTIRHLMGFIKPSAGKTSVLGIDPWNNAPRIMQHVSYIPGEIAFPDFSTGTAFLKSQAAYLGVNDLDYLNHVIKLLQLDTSAGLKRMSKGMKQKTAIVAALMGEKEILILDEPTTGLDPLMRNTFLDLIKTEKDKGRTIFMSSHIFEEIEEVCDRAAMIKDGHIVDIVDLRSRLHGGTKTFRITFDTDQECSRFVEQWHSNTVDKAEGGSRTDDNSMAQASGKTTTVEVLVNETNAFFNLLTAYHVCSLQETHFTLEEHFKNKYQEGAHQHE